MKYKLQKSGSGYMHYIELDGKTVKKLSAGNNKRVTCVLNGKITLHAAIMHTKDGMHYIMIATKYLTQLGLRIGSIVQAENELPRSRASRYLCFSLFE